MDVAGVVLAALLAVAAVLFAARPFLREPEAANDRLDDVGPAERERLRLAEERDRALAALKELEFDHRTGKISDADYRELSRRAPPRGRPGAPGVGPEVARLTRGTGPGS